MIAVTFVLKLNKTPLTFNCQRNWARWLVTEADRELLRQNLERATETFMKNQILIKEFRSMNLDFARMLKEEELRVLKKYL